MAGARKGTGLESRNARLRLKMRHQPYWTTVTKGIGLGYRRGPVAGTWYGRFYVGDKRYEQLQLGAADDNIDANGVTVLTYFQASERARQAAQNRDLTKGIGPKRAMTVAEAAGIYVNWFRLHRRSAETTEATIRAHILPALGQKDIASLTSSEIKAWLNNLVSTPARKRTRKGAPQSFREPPATSQQLRARRSTANRVLTVLKAILNKAFQDDLVRDDRAWRRVTPFKNAADGAIRFLTNSECMRLINAAHADLRSLVRAALYTGARIGELARLTVSEVTPSAGRVYISPAAKSGKGRYIPLSPEGAVFFQDVVAGKAGAELVFVRPDGKPWGKNHHVRSFRDALKQARIHPPIGFHDLRHTYATQFANIPGNTIDLLAEILGHADTRITKRHYAHLFDSSLRNAVRNLPSLGYEASTKVVAIRNAQ